MSVTDITDGRQRRMKLGGVGSSSDGLLSFPGRGVFAFVLSDRSISIMRLNAVPLGHMLVASLPTAQANPVFQGMAGPASLHLRLALIIGLSRLARYCPITFPTSRAGSERPMI